MYGRASMLAWGVSKQLPWRVALRSIQVGPY